LAKPTPEEILNLVRAQLARIHGKSYASLCLLEYTRGGWYYFSEPTIGEKGKLKGNPLAKPMQRREMLQLLENLRALQPKKRKY
jgi:hypothetical protein